MAVGNITGVASGINWGDTVKAMMELEKKPMVNLQDRVERYNGILNNWSTIEGKLGALTDAADAINTADKLFTNATTTSDDTIVTATADSNAIAGSHQILVNQLATNHILVHQTGWADDKLTPVNNSGIDQTFSYSYGGEAQSITVPSGTTLTNLVRLINNDSDNPGVTASIINDGSGGSNAYHLVLSGNESGSENEIIILDTLANPTDLGTGAEFDFAAWSSTQDAQNAQIRVDGFPDPDWGWPTPWIESSSNDVKDIIPGVTLHLANVSADNKVTVIKTSLDKAEAEDRVQKLLTAFNDVVTTINGMTRWDAASKTAGPLANDSLAKQLKDQLVSVIASELPGTNESDRYRSLGEVGISLTSGNKLSLDITKFEKALDADSAAVGRLLTFDAVSSDGFVSVIGHNTKTVGGEYGFTMTYDASGYLDTLGPNTIDGEDASIRGNTIMAGAADTDVEGLLMMLTNPGNGPDTRSGTVRIYSGLTMIISKTIENYTDSVDGQLKGRREQLNSQINSLNDRIDTWNTRLKKIEENYNRKFSNMETLISQMKNQSSYIR